MCWNLIQGKMEEYIHAHDANWPITVGLSEPIERSKIINGLYDCMNAFYVASYSDSSARIDGVAHGGPCLSLLTCPRRPPHRYPPTCLPACLPPSLPSSSGFYDEPPPSMAQLFLIRMNDLFHKSNLFNETYNISISSNRFNYLYDLSIVYIYDDSTKNLVVILCYSSEIVIRFKLTCFVCHHT
jgi:hypothetical protein